MSGDAPEPVQAPPERCPRCGGKVLAIAYGLPSLELIEAAEAGEIVLGGCCIDPDDPDLQCRTCGHRW